METRNWKTIEGFDFKEILFEEYNGIAKITRATLLHVRIAILELSGLVGGR